MRKLLRCKPNNHPRCSATMPLPKPRRSGGPQTAAGRQAVAQNALRTGVYATHVVLPGEDPAQFHELEQQFLHDFAPVDVAESALVHQLAVITWKKLRLDRIEHHNFLALLNRPYLQVELDTVSQLLPRGSAMKWIEAMGHSTPEQREAMALAYDLADKLSEVPAGGYPPGTVAHIQSSVPKLYEYLQNAAEDYNPPIPESGWTTEIITDLDETEGIFLERSCISYCQMHWYAGWFLKHRDKAEQALCLLQDRRLLLSMQQGSVGRIHDDLDRAFQRALNELRRHQAWRRDRATVTVEPTQVAGSANQTNSH